MILSGCLTTRLSTVYALYTLSCTLTVAPLLVVLSTTAFVFYGVFPALCVLTAGLVLVVGLVLYCLMSAKRQLENTALPTNSSSRDEKARPAGFQARGCVVGAEKPGYCDINNESLVRLL